MYATKAPTPEGNHRIKDYVPVKFLKGLGNKRLQLWGKKGKKSTIIVPNITLSSVVEKYIGPGIFLVPYDPLVPLAHLAPAPHPPPAKGRRVLKIRMHYHNTNWYLSEPWKRTGRNRRKRSAGGPWNIVYYLANLLISAYA
jgi:hypothetical protein